MLDLWHTKKEKGEDQVYMIKEMRERKRMTQQELAECSGVSRAIISKLEKNKPTVTTTETICRIAKALDSVYTNQAKTSHQSAMQRI